MLSETCLCTVQSRTRDVNALSCWCRSRKYRLSSSGSSLANRGKTDLPSTFPSREVELGLHACTPDPVAASLGQAAFCRGHTRSEPRSDAVSATPGSTSAAPTRSLFKVQHPRHISCLLHTAVHLAPAQQIEFEALRSKRLTQGLAKEPCWLEGRAMTHMRMHGLLLCSLVLLWAGECSSFPSPSGSARAE